MSEPPPSVRIEITAGLDPNAVTIELVRAEPPSLRDGVSMAPFPCDIPLLPGWPDPEPVRCYGERLFERLSGPNSEKIARAIQQTLMNGGTVDLKFKADQWERHAWEALCKDSNFFLLQPGRGIARIVDPWQTPRSDCRIEQRLRMMAVLSAAGMTGESEWSALHSAVKDNADDRRGLPIELRVLTGEERLLDKINNEEGIAGRLEIRADPIKDKNQANVTAAIKRFRPHLLHFFCHGVFAGGAGALRIAEIDQHREGMRDKNFAESPDGSFAVDYGQLQDIIKASRGEDWLWLIVLNACKLGGGEADVSSLVRKLVAGGAPATVGMTEEIDPIDSGEFCRGFYPAVFAEIGRIDAALTASGAGLEIDWAKLLYEPRNGISNSRVPASRNRQWTLPVLYRQSEPFLIRPGQTDSIRRGQTDLARRFVNDLTPALQEAGASEEVIAAMREPGAAV